MWNSLTAEIGSGKLLRDALPHNHLERNFQPIVELPSGQVRLYEVGGDLGVWYYLKMSLRTSTITPLAASTNTTSAPTER